MLVSHGRIQLTLRMEDFGCGFGVGDMNRPFDGLRIFAGNLFHQGVVFVKAEQMKPGTLPLDQACNSVIGAGSGVYSTVSSTVTDLGQPGSA